MPRSARRRHGTNVIDLGQLDRVLAVACCICRRVETRRQADEMGTFPMAVHKKILEWQADHPNITWIGWGIVWAIVLSLLFWPSKSLH